MEYLGIRATLVCAGAWTLYLALQPDGHGYSATGLELLIGVIGTILALSMCIFLVELCISKMSDTPTPKQSKGITTSNTRIGSESVDSPKSDKSDFANSQDVKLEEI